MAAHAANLFLFFPFIFVVILYLGCGAGYHRTINKIAIMSMRWIAGFNNKILYKRFGTGLILFVISTVLVSCNSETINVKHRVHYSMIKNKDGRLPGRIVLLPVSIPVLKVSPGPVIDQLSSRTKVVKGLVSKSIKNSLLKRVGVRLLAMPALKKQELATIKEHTVLYDLIARNAISYTSAKHTAVWRSKLTHFDYTIGSGLSFLKRKTRAQAAIMVSGAEVLISTKKHGVKSTTYIIVGLVDLDSGALLWMNYSLNPQRSFNQYGDVSYLVDRMFRAYPGIASYRRAIEK